MYQFIYHKISGSKIISLVFYVDDILLATKDMSLQREVKQFLSQQFEMTNMGETSFVTAIKIYREDLKVSWVCFKIYINKILKRFWMKDT